MELTAKEVMNTIGSAHFGGRPFFSFRGVKDDFVFNDEEEMKTFLTLCEGKNEESSATYKPVQNQTFHYLVQTLELDESYIGSYSDDYKQIRNGLVEDVRGLHGHTSTQQ